MVKSGGKWSKKHKSGLKVMFYGEYSHSLDTKGRMNIPAKFRDKLSEPFYMTSGMDGCLFVFAETEWNEFEEKILSIPLSSKNGRYFQRLFLSGAADCTLDKQGRVNVPPHLRKYAGLEKDAIIIGVGKRIEIWSKDKWDAYSDPESIDFDEMAERMAELGI